MTTFIDTRCIKRMVDKIGLAQFFSGLEEQLCADFKRWESFDKCPRLASHSDIGVIELMPIADQTSYGFKYVNGHPANTAKGLSTVMAFGALAEVETGYPELLAELTLTTAFRTAATSVMAARAVARDDCRVMTMIGSGAQSEFQSIAFHYLLGINEVRVFDIDRQAMDKLAHHLRNFPDLAVIKAASTQEAVRGADIVTTCTADKTWATILTPDMIEPGMHINGIGGDCPGKTELHVDILKQAKVFVEYEPQTRIEGDIQQLPAEHPVYDLWKVVTSGRTGRESREQVTVFDSVGFALEDFSALHYLNFLSKELGEGEPINLIPDLANPKDVFSLITDNKFGARAQHYELDLAQA